jgi:hypothetical protein
MALARLSPLRSVGDKIASIDLRKGRFAWPPQPIRSTTTPLPIGVQIICAPWREDVGLRIAYALERMGAVAAPKPNL